MVNRAGDTLDEIVAAIKTVAGLIAGIANACAEQSTGVDEVRKALIQMDEVTQQNSALVEQNAATARTLEDQAIAMNTRVSFFKIKADVENTSSSNTIVRQVVPKVQAPTLVPQRGEFSLPASRPSGFRGAAQASRAAPIWKEF